MHNSYHLSQRYALSTGDVLKSPKSLFNMIQHYALFWGEYDGHAWVVENLVGQGVVYTRFDHYLTRVGRINHIVRYSGSDNARRAIMQRADSCIGQPYDQWSHNCEHLVNWILYGRRYSEQAETAKNVLKGVAALGVLALLVRAGR